MELDFKAKLIKFKKELSNLDLFVKEFTNILNEINLSYVIVSGYISIVFGRSRNTEDVDMIVEPLNFEQFENLWKKLKENFECINTSNIEEAFDYLKSKHAIRFCKKGYFIPNIEFKFRKTDLDDFTLKNKINIIINDDFVFYTSLLELQIVFKLFLGSEKDLEDAKYLYDLFKKYLKEDTLNELLDQFGEEVKERMEKIKR